MSWVAAGVAAAGAITSAENGASAAKKKNRITVQGAREQSRAGMESAGVMGDFLTQLRGSAPNPAVERGAFTGALGPQGVSALPTGSARFRTDAAGATTGAQGYGRTMADLFARIRAPGLQRQGESELMLRMGDALRPLQVRSQDDQFLTELRSGMVQPNPWLGMLGSGLSNVGGSMLANGGRRSVGMRGPATGASIGGNYSDILTNGRVV